MDELLNCVLSCSAQKYLLILPRKSRALKSATEQINTLDGCVMWNAHNTVYDWKRSTTSNRWFLGPTRVLHANGISIASTVFAGLTK